MIQLKYIYTASIIAIYHAHTSYLPLVCWPVSPASPPTTVVPSCTAQEAMYLPPAPSLDDPDQGECQN